MTDATVHIENLRLKLSGFDEGSARAFARMVAENLVPGLTAAVAGGGEVLGPVGMLRVSVQDAAGAAHDAQGSEPLAKTVANEVLSLLLSGTHTPPAGDL